MATSDHDSADEAHSASSKVSDRKDLLTAARVNRKSSGRKRRINRQLNALSRHEKSQLAQQRNAQEAEEEDDDDDEAEGPRVNRADYTALFLLHDPQGNFGPRARSSVLAPIGG